VTRAGPASVRVATEDDVPLLARLRRDWVEELAGGPIEDDDFEQLFAVWFEQESRRRVTWLAELDGDPVGMLNLMVFTRMPVPVPAAGSARPTQWGYVANVYVAAPQRDRGLGRLLLDAAVAHADAHHFARLLLSPSPRSVPFYERAGFVPAVSLRVREPGGPTGG
jgi:GNAT superfamily N-acetyltransferase